MKAKRKAKKSRRWGNTKAAYKSELRQLQERLSDNGDGRQIPDRNLAEYRRQRDALRKKYGVGEFKHTAQVGEGSGLPFNKTRFYQCGRKVLFVSQAEATQRADEIAQEGGAPMRVYQCDWCHGWHLSRVKADEQVEVSDEAV